MAITFDMRHQTPEPSSMLVVGKGGLPPPFLLDIVIERGQATLPDHEHAKASVVPRG